MIFSVKLATENPVTEVPNFLVLEVVEQYPLLLSIYIVEKERETVPAEVNIKELVEAIKFLSNKSIIR